MELTGRPTPYINKRPMSSVSVSVVSSIMGSVSISVSASSIPGSVSVRSIVGSVLVSLQFPFPFPFPCRLFPWLLVLRVPFWLVSGFRFARLFPASGPWFGVKNTRDQN